MLKDILASNTSNSNNLCCSFAFLILEFLDSGIAREKLIRTRTNNRYDEIWGRFPLIEWFNVDQSLLLFVFNSSCSYEYLDGVNQSNVWISQPGASFCYHPVV